MEDSRCSADLTYLQAVLTTLLATTVEGWGFNRDHYTENGVDGIINITVPQLLPPSKRELLARILQRLQDGLTNGPWREIWVIGDSSLDRWDTPIWYQYQYNGTTSGFEDRDDDEEFLGETRWVVEKNPFGGEIFSLRYSILLEVTYDHQQMEKDYLRDKTIILDGKFQKYFTWESTPSLPTQDAVKPYIFDLFFGGQDVFLTKIALEFIEKEGVYSNQEP